VENCSQMKVIYQMKQSKLKSNLDKNIQI